MDGAGGRGGASGASDPSVLEGVLFDRGCIPLFIVEGIKLAVVGELLLGALLKMGGWNDRIILGRWIGSVLLMNGDGAYVRVLVMGELPTGWGLAWLTLLVRFLRFRLP